MIITTDFVGINKAYREIKDQLESQGMQVMSFPDFLFQIQIPIQEIQAIEEINE